MAGYGLKSRNKLFCLIMKLIILAAARSSAISVSGEEPPVCLRAFDSDSTILDRTLALGERAGTEKNILVGGYRLLDILKAYPDLQYFYNDDWEKTGSLSSLMEAASEFTGDLLISYSDVVHQADVIDALARSPGEIVIAHDSAWEERYEGRTQEVMTKAEVVWKNPDGEISISKGKAAIEEAGGSETSIFGEYAGLVLLRGGVVEKLHGVLSAILQSDERAGMEQLFAKICKAGEYSLVDICGKWAELDTETDLAQFKFGTKAETLSKLEGALNGGTILPQVTLSVGEWTEGRETAVRRVRQAFGEDSQVVVRSSGINEDMVSSSMAGNFESVLHVPTGDFTALARAIDVVSESFKKDGARQLDANQVLIQPMLSGVMAAGVVFTEDLETSAPYYIINYDESGSTESITSGATNEHHTLIVTKRSADKVSDPQIAALLRTIQEIETTTGFHSLDIEFAICKDESGTIDGFKVFILQARPIAAQKDQLRVSAVDVEAELDAISEYLVRDRTQASVLCGKKVVYGVMPDWNPAEMIGINPRPLAFSLYRHLISDGIWGESRRQCGYRATSPRPGIVNFGGKPYVDVRMSFTSFVPSTLSENLADRLVENAVEALQKNPALHDKVEFGVMPTAYDVNFSHTIAKLRVNGFSDEECAEISAAYRELTNNIITGRKVSVETEMENVSRLEGRREEIKESIKREGPSWNNALLLLDQCRQFGTLPFSNLARFGFIGVIQLKGLVARGVLTQKRSDEFLASIHTVAKDFVNDLASLPREELIHRYGHLRPGTYDITSPAYHENFDGYVDLSHRPSAENLVPFNLSEGECADIGRVLKEVGLDCTPEGLFDFIRKAVIGREKGKFEFTKNLSFAMDCISNLAEADGLDRDSLSYLKITELLECAFKSISSNAESIWTSTIKRRKRAHTITSSIKLPEVITGETDLEQFYLSESQPNYITQRAITAPVLALSGPSNDVEGKICLIENADPGFDWLFSHKIAGLITAYGGANSHMAIRCAEFEIPAVIGCGEALFQTMKSASRVRVDCAAKRMEPL